ncbi:MAG TPA: hypothetical protein VHM89_00495 [Acidimicrobiales bacterium]|nr:hypothetical protein [Acidimicrobiales bacterium]
MLERLPERARTPAVARAVTSPSAVLLAGAGMSAAILGGLPLVAAAAVGVLAWGARVAMAVPRRPREERIDPFTVGEPWRHFVTDALQARSKFEQTVARARPGPLCDRLVALGERLDHGVRECWRIARQGDGLQAALGQLDIDQIRNELAEVQRELKRCPSGERASLERAEAAVRSQLASAERLAGVSRDAGTRLRVLNAQMDEAVARAVELSVTAADGSDLAPLSDDVESLVGELESLRLALEETAAAGGRPGR